MGGDLQIVTHETLRNRYSKAFPLYCRMLGKEKKERYKTYERKQSNSKWENTEGRILGEETKRKFFVNLL